MYIAVNIAASNAQQTQENRIGLYIFYTKIYSIAPRARLIFTHKKKCGEDVAFSTQQQNIRVANDYQKNLCKQKGFHSFTFTPVVTDKLK